MGLDRYINEKLALSRIAEDQRLAQTLRAYERLEEERQAKQSMARRWLSRLLRTLATGRIPNLNGL
jgi:hypothetical protein